MIEQACLPDHCEVSCADGENLTIRLGQGSSPDDCLTVAVVPIANLNNCRDLVNLIDAAVAALDVFTDNAPIIASLPGEGDAVRLLHLGSRLKQLIRPGMRGTR
ncbi:hypothetical protein WR25_09403 [Diploscapter pachys]|uniref:DUF1652 domain-containing protein n=1 Tax=Diploscapter pachys TaxID=2018661 RepID=A0A2A2KCB8_9BILA|nr:hypothetical protein WR25_09403 [Diploscapter pachys]